MAPTNLTFGLSPLTTGFGAAVLVDTLPQEGFIERGTSGDSLLSGDTFVLEPPAFKLEKKIFHPDSEPLSYSNGSGRMGSGLFNPDGLWRGVDRFEPNPDRDAFVQDKTKYGTQPKRSQTKQVESQTRTLAEDIESLGGALLDHLTKPESAGGYSADLTVIAGHVVRTFDQDLTLEKLGEYLRTGLEKIYNIGGLLLVNSNLPGEVKTEIEKAIDQQLISEVKLVQIEKTKSGKEAEEADVIRAISSSGYFDEAIDWQSFIDESQLRWGNAFAEDRTHIDITKSQYAWLKDYQELKEFVQKHIDNITERDLEKFYTILHPQRDGEVLLDTELQASQNNLLGLLGEIEFRNRLIQNYNQILNTHPNAVLILEHDIRVNGRLASDAIIGTIDPGTKTITIHKIVEMTMSDSQDESTRTQMRKTVDERLREHGLTLTHEGLRATVRVAMDSAFRAEAIWVHTKETHQILKSIAEKTVSQLTTAIALGGMDENKVKGKQAHEVLPYLMARLIAEIKSKKPKTLLELKALVDSLVSNDAAKMSGNHLGWNRISWVLKMMTNETIASEYNVFYSTKAAYLWSLVVQLDEALSLQIERSSSFAQFKRIMASAACQKIVKAKTEEELVQELKEADLDEIYNVVNNVKSKEGDNLILAGSSHVFEVRSRADSNDLQKDRMTFNGVFGFYSDASAIKKHFPRAKFVRFNGKWVVDVAGENLSGNPVDKLMRIIRLANIPVMELVTELGLVKTEEHLIKYLGDQNNIQKEVDKLGAGLTRIILSASNRTILDLRKRVDPFDSKNKRNEFNGRFVFFTDEREVKEYAPKMVLVKVDGQWVVDAAGDNVNGLKASKLLNYANKAKIKIDEIITRVGLAKTVDQLSQFLSKQENIQSVANQLGGVVELYLAGNSPGVFSQKEKEDPQNPGNKRYEFNGWFHFCANKSEIHQGAPQVKLVRIGEKWVVDVAGKSVRGNLVDQLLKIVFKSMNGVELVSNVSLVKTEEQLRTYLSDQRNIQNEADKLGVEVTQMILAGSNRSILQVAKRDDLVSGEQRLEFVGSFKFHLDESNIEAYAPQIRLAKVDGVWIVDQSDGHVKGLGAEVKLKPLVLSALAE